MLMGYPFAPKMKICGHFLHINPHELLFHAQEVAIASRTFCFLPISGNQVFFLSTSTGP